MSWYNKVFGWFMGLVSVLMFIMLFNVLNQDVDDIFIVFLVSWLVCVCCGFVFYMLVFKMKGDMKI